MGTLLYYPVYIISKSMFNSPKYAVSRLCLRKTPVHSRSNSNRYQYLLLARKYDIWQQQNKTCSSGPSNHIFWSVTWRSVEIRQFLIQLGSTAGRLSGDGGSIMAYNILTNGENNISTNLCVLITLVHFNYVHTKINFFSNKTKF